MKRVTQDLWKLNHRVANKLNDISFTNEAPKGLSPALVFPAKRNGEIRISEQEARLLYCKELDDSSYYYSLETPTNNKYNFSNQKGSGRSGNVDLTIYKGGEKFHPAANIEFKKGQPEQKYVNKDLKKLIRESPPGNWFHVVKNANATTISSLFAKFQSGLISLKNSVPDKTSIIFCIVVLELGWGCIKNFFMIGLMLVISRIM